MDVKNTIPFFLYLVSLISIIVAHVENFEEILGKSTRTESFANFARKYGKKTYAKPEELKQRFDVFSKNMDLIESTNRRRLSYTLGVNQFADWSWEEFKTKMLQTAPQHCSVAMKNGHMLRADILPKSIDWRKKGIVSPVKSQDGCGSCWAFSTTGTLEAAYHKKFGKGISLSEQQLIDCAGAFNNKGCKGGLPSQGLQYIKYNGGLESERAYPYQHIDGECKFSKDEVVVRVQETINITTGSEDELKHAIATVGPVSISFDVHTDFKQYSEGIFRSNKCLTGPNDINHAMVAVGYGKGNGIPYWIVKNSWGADWGEDGYTRIEMGKNICGIAACASYPILA